MGRARPGGEGRLQVAIAGTRAALQPRKGGAVEFSTEAKSYADSGDPLFAQLLSSANSNEVFAFLKTP